MKHKTVQLNLKKGGFNKPVWDYQANGHDAETIYVTRGDKVSWKLKQNGRPVIGAIVFPHRSPFGRGPLVLVADKNKGTGDWTVKSPPRRRYKYTVALSGGVMDDPEIRVCDPDSPNNE